MKSDEITKRVSLDEKQKRAKVTTTLKVRGEGKKPAKRMSRSHQKVRGKCRSWKPCKEGVL